MILDFSFLTSGMQVIVSGGVFFPQNSKQRADTACYKGHTGRIGFQPSLLISQPACTA